MLSTPVFWVCGVDHFKTLLDHWGSACACKRKSLALRSHFAAKSGLSALATAKGLQAHQGEKKTEQNWVLSKSTQNPRLKDLTPPKIQETGLFILSTPF
jgi:hypothetical protein